MSATRSAPVVAFVAFVAFVAPVASAALCVTLAGCGREPDARVEQTSRAEDEPLLTSSPVIVPGRTQASFRVDHHGTATYAIPIIVPPGSGDMAPSLSLQYASDAGPGIAGFGWSVAGLHAVGRCPSTIAQDGVAGRVDYSDSDQFCMDGQRLVLVESNSTYREYRLELEGFSRVRAIGGTTKNPDSWEVNTKSGQTLYFGLTKDARIAAEGRADIRVWALDKLRDTKGNYFTVRYTHDPLRAEFYASRIQYTGNDLVAGHVDGAQAVEFVYENRPDTSLAYVHGDRVENTVRLSRIRTYVDKTTLVREYRLGYTTGTAGRSLLSTVQECTPEGTNGTCYAPLTFTYRPTTFALGSATTWGTGHRAEERVADFDGDGATDLFDVRQGAAYVSLSTRTALPTPTVWGSGFGTDEKAIWPVDVNNDHRTDLLEVNTSGVARAWISTGSSFGPAITWGEGFGTDPQKVRLVDMNADGRSDILFVDPSGNAFVALGSRARLEAPKLWASLGTNNMDRLKFGDVNGDAKADILVLSEQGSSTLWLSGRDRALPEADAWGTHGTAFGELHFADLNGDGKDDLARLSTNGDLVVWLSTGRSFAASSVWTTGVVADDSLADMNGDGRADLVRLDPVVGRLRVNQNMGARFAGWQEWGNPSFIVTTPLPAPVRISSGPYGGVDWSYTACSSTAPYSGYRSFDPDQYCRARNFAGSPSPTSFTCTNFLTGGTCGYSACSVSYVSSVTCVEKGPYGLQVGDFNGDGKPDPISFHNDGRATVLLGQSPHPDVLSKIADGVGGVAGEGAKTFIEYAPTTDGNVYAKDTDAVYPQQDLLGASLQVVSRVYESQGVPAGDPATSPASYRATSFFYRGAKVDGSGRGYLGFREVTHTTVNEDGTPIQTVTSYHQNFPFTGMPVQVRKFVGANLVSQTDQEYEAFAYATERQPTRYFAYLKQTTVSGKDPSGTPLPTTVTSNTHDAWGNLLLTTTTGEGYSVTTQNAFSPPDIANWVLGRLTSAKVTHARGVSRATRTSAFEYEAGTGLLLREIVEPSDPALRVETSYAYDAWGHKTAVSVKGRDVPERIKSAKYDSLGRFLVEETNALGHVSRFETDARSGLVTRSVDPNGIATAAAYDGFGRKTSETRADGVTIIITYGFSAGTSVVTITTPGAPTAKQYLDLLGREVRRESIGLDGRAILQDTVYNADGRPAKKSLPYFAGETAAFTSFAYDGMGRTIRETAPDGSVVATQYSGLTETTTNGKGQRRIRQKDPQGQLVKVTDALGGEIAYRYDPFGQITETTDARGYVTSIAYDLRGRKLSLEDPSVGRSDYIHNALGELVTQTSDATPGVSRQMTYDALGRMISRREGSEVTTWTYDACPNGKGKVCSVTGPSPDYSHGFSYDTAGRVVTETTRIDGVDYTLVTSYDSVGRVDSITYPSGYAIKHEYNTRGYLVGIREVASGTLVYSVTAQSADGQVLREVLGNGMVTAKTIDPKTTHVTGIVTGTSGAPTSVQNASFAYDVLGNLTKRGDAVNGYEELFDYDASNRLAVSRFNRFKNAPVSPTPAPETPAALLLEYDRGGNILSKSDVGAFSYNAKAPATGRALPFAVSAAGNRAYAYDNAGNMTTGMGRTISWTSFHMPKRIESNTIFAEFSYGENHQRTKQVTNDETVVYVSSLYEKITRGSSTVQKAYVYAGKELILVHTKKDGVGEVAYVHRDHLGSVVATSNASAQVVDRLSYDAFGKRRKADGSAISTVQAQGDLRRGYTGHEMLDTWGLVHMNGRIQDPTLGRFLSADPFVQAPEESQSFNRYSYVWNNPLSMTDPSGYFSLKKLFRVVVAVVAIALAVTGQVYLLAAYLKVAMGSFVATMVMGAIGGAVMGFVFGGTLKAAFMGAFTGAMFGAIGTVTAGNFVANVLAHGAFGGMLNVVQGGDFVSGFMSNAFSAMVSPGLMNATRAIGNQVIRHAVGTAVSAVVGGVTSVLGGGKFENGAMSAAYGYLFNAASHEREEQEAKIRKQFEDTRARLIQEGKLDPNSRLWNNMKSVFGGSELRCYDLATEFLRDAKGLGFGGDFFADTYINKAGASWSFERGYDGFSLSRGTVHGIGVPAPDVFTTWHHYVYAVPSTGNTMLRIDVWNNSVDVVDKGAAAR